MIPINTWVNKLIGVCARKDERNSFQERQTFLDDIELKNNALNIDTDSTLVYSGTTHTIRFTDTNDNTLGSLTAFKSSTDYIGMQLEVQGHTLGFKVTTSAFGGDMAITYVDHPIEEGPSNQIADIQYVLAKKSELEEIINWVASRVTNLENKIPELEAKIAQLVSITGILSRIDSEPTKGSTNLVTSGGVYSFVNRYTDSIDDLISTLIKKKIEEIKIDATTLGGSGFRFGFNIGNIRVQAFQVRKNTFTSYPFGSYSSTPIVVGFGYTSERGDTCTSSYMGRIYASREGCSVNHDDDERHMANTWSIIAIGSV